ncbi:hypothetical protein TBLA_0I01570 [Henningerozyma blattae CBS 6284]|uniref:Clu domain-containing protein n=1 Tax=Henningerozyma blattae (strain ATCC 34711 / CBS 6284 / DSM 70876 / NBRC 10599 / NRRL Y-10934 / UCD 77-7) TaxID=1071380 RepID=I2H8W4_HENB6|nr:hypothetical protein TBLA_0I01570 [Tetrapisispora blattae CBS 6284]CCH62816.1 hypothetical protein TBLA_0I01570 [Tetrapisispora blattae CBS 6284]
MAETATQSEAIKVTIKIPDSIASKSNNVTHRGKSNKNNASAKNNSTKELVLPFDRSSKVNSVFNLMSFPTATRYFTNFNLKYNGKILNHDETFEEILNDKDKKIDNFTLNIDIKPYTTNEALKHIINVREFIGFSDESVDALSEFAISTGSKFSELKFDEIKEKSSIEEVTSSTTEEEQKKKTVLKIDEAEKQKFIENVHEIFELAKSSSIKNIMSTEMNLVKPCVRSLALSSYNPVPAFYRTKGHLLYLQVITLEGETFHITCIPSGFYVNNSTVNRFDPSIKILDSSIANEDELIKYTLFDLLSTVSKKFSSHVNDLDKNLEKLDSVQYVKAVSTYLHKPWLITNIPSNPGDYMKLQIESFNADENQNYNSEFQTILELPTSSVEQRLEYERLSNKIIHDFTTSSVKGAMSILYKDLSALNPDDDIQQQIFLKDRIFYSFVDDINGDFATKGGEAAAIASSNQDLHTINILNRLNIKNIHYLLTTIIDFAGRRILAQTPIPGLLSPVGLQTVKDPETNEETVQDLPNDITVKHGFNDTLNELVFDKSFDDLIKEDFSRLFHLKTHEIQGNDISFASTTKGITGSDKRNYIIDLANTYPLDVNFAKEHFDDKSETERYPHRQTLLRPELVENWWASKLKETDKTIENGFNERLFTYNPDAYQVKGVEDSNIQEMSDYLKETVIPSVLNKIVSGAVNVPYNGENLINILHKDGINVRYLGYFTDLAKKELKEQTEVYENRLKEIETGNKDYQEWEAEYLKKIETMITERQKQVNKYIEEGKEVPKELTGDLNLDENEIRKPTNEKPIIINTDELLPLINLAELEMISRSLKHILRELTKPLPVPVVPSMIAYILNLLFGTKYNPAPVPETSDPFYHNDSYEFSKLKRADLLNRVVSQTKLRFRYDLDSEWINKFDNCPFVLLRSISKKFGIQLVNKDYYFSKDQYDQFVSTQDKKVKNKLVAPENTFSSNDLTIVPVIKGLDHYSSLSEEFWNEGLASMEENGKIGLTLLGQSVAVTEEVYGILHKSVAEKYLSLSTVYSKLNLIPEAIAFCRKSCMIYERICGVDSFELLRAMSNLAFLEYSNGSPYNASVVYKRLVETSKAFNSSELKDSSIVNAFNSLEQLSLGIEDARLTIEILNKTSELIVEMGGKDSLAYATNESKIGNLYASAKEYQKSLSHLAVTREIFTKQLGINNLTTVQSRQWVEGLNGIIQDARNKKKLEAEQSGSSSTKVKSNNNTTKKHNKKAEKVQEDLADKSVDELLAFIESGDQKKSDKKKSKKSGKK